MPTVHVVSSGETLVSIATLYDTTVENIQLLNGIGNADVLFVGQELIIPGDFGELVATVYTVAVGDTVEAVAQRFDTPPLSLAVNNRLLRPELRVGQRLAVLSGTGSPLPVDLTGTPHIVQPGETVTTIAARYQVSIAALQVANDFAFPTQLRVGQRVRIPGAAPYSALPGTWRSIELRGAPLRTGDTVVVYVENLLDGTPTGRLGEQPLRFTPAGDGFVALAGFDPLDSLGALSLELSGSGNQPWVPFRQQLTLGDGGWGTQQITLGAGFEDLLDPSVRASEDEFLASIFSQFNEEQLWSGAFQVPVTPTITISADYGALRSYNGGPYEIFHTGVDYALPTGSPVIAPADGVVVFADFLRLRGNVVIVDHGLGVMTGYYHLETIFVTPGMTVERGIALGTIGSTGLSTGPHLHWDVRINNVPVNGGQWLLESFP